MTAQQMGLGLIGTSTNRFKRKFRWTLSIDYCNGDKTVPSDFVKVASRPKLSIDETQIDYLHGRFWIPGKGSFDEMTISYYDVAADTAAKLFGWLASVYDFTDPVNLTMGSSLGDYEGTGNLYLYDGCGNEIEYWILEHMWPKAINFGELDMESSDVCMIELTVRYSYVQYVAVCPSATVDKCPCTSC